MGERSVIGGTLGVLVVALSSLGAGALFGYWGLDIYIGESSRNVERAHDFVDSTQRMESALLYWSFATLAVLISFVAFFALVKGLFDDLSRGQRGPLERGLGDEVGPGRC